MRTTDLPPVELAARIVGFTAYYFLIYRVHILSF
jgi:hypothetical protein